ncbi:MAG TPA: hypothetical protein VFD72_05405 [Sphingobacteriaceae bacterium]|nr:hypothetical protein [Sphingobacteriaceae bacterium]
MKTKTIFIIILTALVTIILMKNADEVNFWIFGDYTIPKLAVLGTMFLIGVIVGWMLGRSKKKKEIASEPDPNQMVHSSDEFEEYRETSATNEDHTLDDEDRDYLK